MDKPLKMKLARVELLVAVPMPDGTPNKDSLVPLETTAGVLEVKPLGPENMRFPGFSVRSSRTGHEVHVPPHLVKAVYYTPDNS
jgi:hypothetical protein